MSSSAAWWTSAGVAAIPVYGLIAGGVARLARTQRWGHARGEYADCRFLSDGECDCGWWSFCGWIWPITVALVVLVGSVNLLLVRPAAKMYRAALGDDWPA